MEGGERKVGGRGSFWSFHVLEAVAKSTWVEGQIFISLFLPCWVRPCKCLSAKASISGGLRARGQDIKAHDDAVLQCPVGSSRHSWWRMLVLQARAAMELLHHPGLALGKELRRWERSLWFVFERSSIRVIFKLLFNQKAVC